MTTQDAPKMTRAAAKLERRQQIIDATMTSIARHGLSGTTIARVSEIAGTSVGLANFHFETKEKLLEATLQTLADEQRALWQTSAREAALPPAARLVAIAESNFHPRICERRKLAVWFAFWGDASAREIYRRVIAARDDERLNAAIAALTTLFEQSGRSDRDAYQTALGLEALYDGLWLNMLLYPNEFKRLSCRDRALDHLAALLPDHVPTPQSSP